MNIIGHQKERERLCRIVQEGKVSQSYVFVGPQGVGKSLCALEFASLLTGKADFAPSEHTPHPLDVLIVKPERETKRGVTKEKNIPIETIREALAFLGSFPIHGRYRVVIIEEAHKLSQAAQNALLKTLEEPQSTAVIILVTHDIGSLVPTIVSRTERVRFSTVAAQEIEHGMHTLFPGNKQLAIEPFFYSIGRPGMIVRAARSPQEFLDEKETLGKLFRLSTLLLYDRLQLAEHMAKDVPGTIRLLEWWVPGLHAQALKTHEIRHTSQFFTLLEEVEKTRALLKTTQSNARLLLEKLLLSI